MALLYSNEPKLGSSPPDFSLLGTDDRVHTLSEYRNARALLVIFMCNHCPYVQAVDDRINRIARDYSAEGLRVVGINPNDADKYPADSFEKMKERAKLKEYGFDYLVDPTQEVARAYGAVCTPDLFLYGRNSSPASPFELRYQGRIDDSWKDEAQVTRRELEDAVRAVLGGVPVSAEQKPSMGCSIKWKAKPLG